MNEGCDRHPSGGAVDEHKPEPEDHAPRPAGLLTRGIEGVVGGTLKTAVRKRLKNRNRLWGVDGHRDGIEPRAAL